MQVIDIVCDGVHRLVPTTDSETLNNWFEKGYKMYKVDGKPVIKEVKTENTVGHIVDAELREAIMQANAQNTVNDITKSVTETYNKVAATK